MRLGTTAAAALIASGAGWIAARMMRDRGGLPIRRSSRGVDYITGQKGGYPHFGEERIIKSAREGEREAAHQQ